MLVSEGSEINGDVKKTVSRRSFVLSRELEKTTQRLYTCTYIRRHL